MTIRSRLTGRTTDHANLRSGIAQGPHARGAARLAQDLRRLRKSLGG